MTSAVLKLSPVDTPHCVLPVTAALTLAEVMDLVGAPDWFRQHGVIRLDGHVVAPENWRRVRVRPEGCSVIELCVVPAGKNTLALMATVATVALATAVSGGLLGPSGLGLFGASFAAGGLGATAAAAGVGIAGQLLVSALTAPPKPGGKGQQDQSKAMAGVQANAAQLFAPLPVIMGKMRVSPPLLAPVYTTFTQYATTVHAVVGVEGRCLVENVLINGVDSALIDSLAMETREGAAGDADRTIAMQTVVEQRDGVILSNFKTASVTSKKDRLADQDDPDSSMPQWHYFETSGTWDEVWIRLLLPGGAVDVSSSTRAIVPVRIQARKKGDSVWRAFPTLHLWDERKGTGAVRAEVKVVRGLPASGPHYSNAVDEYAIVEANATTGIGESFEYEADAYFVSPGMGSDILPVMTAATTSGVTMSASSEAGSNEAWKAADSSSSTGWRSSTAAFPHWLKIDLGAAQTVKSYHMTFDLSSAGAEADYTPVDFYWEGSSDDVTYTRLDAENVRLAVPNQHLYGQIGTPGSYRYYRLTIDNNNGAAAAETRINGLELFTSDVDGSAIGADVAAAYGSLALHSSTADPRCRHVSLTPDGCEIYLDPAEWDAGTYEFRIMRGVAFKDTGITWPGYEYDGGPANSDFFERRTSSGFEVVYIGQKNYRSDLQVEVFSTVDYSEPFDATGVALVAIAVPDMQVDSISAEFTRYAPTWNGAIWSAAETPTANPAAMDRQLLLGGGNADPLPGEIVDDAELGAWYARCASAGHEVNAVLSGQTVEGARQIIAAAGYASPRASELWGVVEDYDTVADGVTQAITPLNSRDLGTSIIPARVPHAIHAEYADASDNWRVKHLTVYRDGYTADNATLFEAISYDGWTDAARLEDRAAFDLKQPLLRQRRYLREMGIEGFSLRRGHLVRLVDDVLETPVAYGVIRAVTMAGSKTKSVTLDNIMPFSAGGGIGAVQDIEALSDILLAGRPVGIAIRLDDGTQIMKLVKEITDSKTCTFAEPFASPALSTGMLVFAGVFGVERRRCKVAAVEPTSIETRVVTLFDEAPELWGSEAAVLSPASGLLDEAADGLAAMFVYSSMTIKDTVTPANDFDGLPEGALTLTRASAASAWQASVLDTGLANNEFAYDSAPLTGAGRGVRIEGARTNLVTYSADLSNAIWVKNNVTVTADAATAPDGTAAADSVIESASTVRHVLSRNALTVTADAVFTASYFVKPVTGSAQRYPIVYLSDGAFNATNRAGVVFDLENLASQSGSTTGANTPTVVDKGIEQLPDGWFRIWVAGTIGGGDTTVGAHLGLCETYGNYNIGESYAGDGVSGFHVWGGQFEDSARFPSSHIATTSATVTRAADQMTIAASGFNWGASEGAVSLVGRSPTGLDGDQVIWQADDGSENNRYRLVRKSTGHAHFIVTAAGVQQFDLDLGALADDTRFGIAASWRAAKSSGSLSGAAAVTAGAATMPPASVMRLGHGFSGNGFFGHIETVRYQPARVSSALAEALSAI